jgi:UDPglucose 6-dehydrogenase
MLERELGGICGRDFSVCYNPEFIALGDVINGLLEPD